MKILSYSSYFYPYISGITVYQARVFNQLIKRHQITVLTFSRKQNVIQKKIDKKIKVIQMPYLCKISKGFISIQSLYFFYKEVRKVDVVLLHVPNFEALLLAVFAKVMQRRIVAFYYCEVYLGKDLHSQIIMFFLNMSVVIQLYLADTIIAIPDYINPTRFSKTIRQKILTIYPPIERIPVNRDIYKKLKKEKDAQIWIGFIGRISREKGVEYLINACRLLYKKHKNIRLIFIGPSGDGVVGEEAYYKKINILLAKEKLPHTMYGLLEEDRLAAVMKNLDVLVLPSINHTEAFGMVQAEAMLLGVPVVATDLPGVRMPIAMTGMGRLAKSKDSSDLATKMGEVIVNKKGFYKTTKEIEKVFSSKRTIDAIERILKGSKNASG